MHKFLFYIVGLPTSWILSECILLFPSKYTASLIDFLIPFAPTYDKLIITYVFNFSELLMTLFIVLIIMLLLVKLFKEEFIKNKLYYLLGNISSFLFILFFVFFFIEYDKEGMIIFIEKILFSIVGVALAWFIVSRRVVNT